ncbi:uncharacterized protein F4822DRAFT_204561 [Hypoxylon trugodes]|uniref:uncharacterized protein n=1 Tax=Hypoxylon trugodes TaxID=326681 RepID=UPI0021A1F4E8|nr:uncharacterized protein F4822DRAFT_204561 [Hypoxylon trugodes]KAI1389548.1 hypothetical protein F4822DRAFT_204561 [Hypoxylon trugodes]
MKSAAVAAAILASVAVAQPHGHHRHAHAKRELVTEWETVWETATVIIDDESTQTIAPSHQETSSGYPGQFFQTPSASPSSSSAPAPTPTTTVSLSKATSYSVSIPSVPSVPSVPIPAPSSEETPTQAPTTAQPAPSSTSTYAATPSGSGSSTGSDGIPFNQKFSGEITYYNAALGACGYEDTGVDDSENIVAIPKAFWNAISTLTSYGINQPAHPLCDKTITITAPNGKTTTAKIRDRCDGCSGDAIDVTPHTFKDLFGSLDAGRLDCSWTINE